MKRWKLILAMTLGILIIATVLFLNKQKMAANTSGTIKDAFYVSVEKAVSKNLSTTFTLTGTVFANNDVNIMSETSGKVTGIFVKPGDYKSAGSVLIQVDDELKKAAYMSAQATYEKAKKDYERFKQLYEQKSATDAQLDQVKTAAVMAEAQYIVAKRQLEDTKIKTPISGYITSRNVDLGAMVQGAPQATFVANVVDISSIKIKLNVSENDAFSFKVGDIVKVTTEVYSGAVFDGRIESISAKADDAHTYPVEISVRNQNKHMLKAGMFVRVEFETKRNGNSIVIQRAALIGSIREPQIFVVENGIANIRNLVLGTESGTFVEVLSGLNEGESIVVDGQNILTDNTKVEIIESKED
ncbi:MAG: efflux RND transporter periplasmic adaptor subunit [bacterium]